MFSLPSAQVEFDYPPSGYIVHLLDCITKNNVFFWCTVNLTTNRLKVKVNTVGTHNTAVYFILIFKY